MPPVTAERSPPASRMTGADSPVIADSLTEATPSMMSPSPGMMSPASTSTTSPTLEVERVDGLELRPLRFVGIDVAAWRACRCGCVRSASACALPRPSATASAKLANSTVNHSQAAIWPENAAAPLWATRSRTNRTVTTAETTSVTKITGLRASARGSSLRKASTAAAPMILRVEQALRLRLCEDMGTATPIRRSCRRASGSARRPARARAPGNIAAGRG